MNDFAPIERLASDLLRSVAPPARRKILAAIARDVRKSQSDRIARQRNPDGSAFEPRRAKPTSAKRKGKLRRKRMFAKLRLARHLKATANANEASIGYAGRSARIARIHQEGGMDAPASGMSKVRYARRILLGLNEAELQRALDIALSDIGLSRP